MTNKISDVWPADARDQLALIEAEREQLSAAAQEALDQLIARYGVDDDE